MGCLDNITKVVNESAKPNGAQLMGSQDRELIVPMYNWCRYFEEVTVKSSLKGISQMHHFCFTRQHPGKVFVKDNNTGKEWCINLLKDPSWRASAQGHRKHFKTSPTVFFSWHDY